MSARTFAEYFIFSFIIRFYLLTLQSKYLKKSYKSLQNIANILL
ncbi:hypothetical protein HMPREF9419_0184 [Prevotella nigrescens ATCC 33563]|nr:hypothetical protein HMPREF9419_0184 [Prevotella nigrescens ATCC 33563]